MSTKKIKGNSQSGFSLVELMVVVAIIGVLATIAVPRVTKFIAKSRQSEAQVNLSSIYTTNANFFTEFQGYTTNFNAMGYRPTGKLYYNTGFGANYIPDNFGIIKGATALTAVGTDHFNTNAICGATGAITEVCTMLKGATNAAPPTIAGTVTIAPTASSIYTAESRARLVSSAVDDVWTINHNKQLNNTADGTTAP